ncbi:MAG: energy transducer TonB [Gemmatimonadota bacterium]|nr:energy transducer TonB [Gemmatimonadota bacterium]MDH3422001.1 energy transducer TonB [Gemmatimonadota bacterium]
MHEPPKGRSANQRFKDRWEGRVAWSTTGAVLFHAALFSWVGFQVVLPLMDRAPSQGQLTLLPPSFSEGAGLEGRSTPLALEEEEAAEQEEAESAGLDGSEAGGTGDGDEAMELWSAAAQRLGYRGIFRADVVEMDSERPADREGEADADSLSIEALASDALAELAYGDSLDLELSLDRLTELRPELAVMIPSMWILLRNPTDVETFLRRSYSRWMLDRDEPGTVTVTVWIDTKGSVEWAEVSRSSGRGELDEAALALFNEVVAFRPARHEGVSISGSATFALLFPW